MIHFKDNKNKSALSTRWAQMSKQEQIIERKKMEIQAKLEAQKQAAALAAQAKLTNPQSDDKDKKNIFSNDGSFMSQFKALLEKQMQDKIEEQEKHSDGEEQQEPQYEENPEVYYQNDDRRDRGQRDRQRHWNDGDRHQPQPRHSPMNNMDERKNFLDNKHSIPSLMQIPMMHPNPQHDDNRPWMKPDDDHDSNEENPMGPRGPGPIGLGPMGPRSMGHGPMMPHPGMGRGMMPPGMGGPMGHGPGSGMGPGMNHGPMGPGPNMGHGPNSSMGPRPGMGHAPGMGPNSNMGPGSSMDPNTNPSMGPGPGSAMGSGSSSNTSSGSNIGSGPNMPPRTGPGPNNMGPGPNNMGSGPNMPPGMGPGPNHMGSGPNMPPGMGPGSNNMGSGPNMPPVMGPNSNKGSGPNMPPGMGPGSNNMGSGPNMPPGMGPGPNIMGPGPNMPPGMGPGPGPLMGPRGPMPPFMGGSPNFPMPPNFMGPNGPCGPMPPNMCGPNGPNGPMPPFFGPPFMGPNGPNSMMPPNSMNNNMPFMGPRPPFGPNGPNFGPNGPPMPPFMPMPDKKPIDNSMIPPESMPLPPMPMRKENMGNTNSNHQVFSPDGMPQSVFRAADEVARNGDHWENVLKAIHSQDQTLWFLHNTNSNEYKAFRELVNKMKSDTKPVIKPEDKYEPEFSLEDDESNDDVYGNIKSEYHDSSFKSGMKREQASSQSDDEAESKRERRKKKKSRWSDEPPATDIKPPGIVTPMPSILPAGAMLAKIDEEGIRLSNMNRNNQALMQYAMTNYGTTNLSGEDWKKCEDNFKLNLLYQDMLKKRQEVERLAAAGKFKYEYDSDEDTNEGTWEHKLRAKEMNATEKWATELTKQAAGKHHIGDFLPPEELKKFMEKYSAVKSGKEPDLSDYKEFKLKEDNVGFKMLQKLGWTEGQGLGAEGGGIIEPINKGNQPMSNLGLGASQSDNVNPDDDEFDAYRKRMMLAYRFRPNPLNNPRRPYY